MTLSLNGSGGAYRSLVAFGVAVAGIVGTSPGREDDGAAGAGFHAPFGGVLLLILAQELLGVDAGADERATAEVMDEQVVDDRQTKSGFAHAETEIVASKEDAVGTLIVEVVKLSNQITRI
jgi:hypothetical protein